MSAEKKKKRTNQQTKPKNPNIVLKYKMALETSSNDNFIKICFWKITLYL